MIANKSRKGENFSTNCDNRNQNNAILEASEFLNWKAERIATNCSEKVSVNIQATLPIVNSLTYY